MARKRNLDLPTAKRSVPETERAQAFVAAAHQSVTNAIDAFDVLKSKRAADAGKKAVGGRLTDAEEDLLRAAIAFSGAGLDAALKQLVRDALPALTTQDLDASEKFQAFAERAISATEAAIDAKTLVRILASDAPSPRAALVELYLEDLTSGSMQSIERVDAVCGALGVNKPALRKRIGAKDSPLRQLFTSRNQIVHELDLQDTSKPGDRRKHTRTIEKSCELSREALSVAQLVINEVSQKLTA